jgi:hypothetical protein
MHKSVLRQLRALIFLCGLGSHYKGCRWSRFAAVGWNIFGILDLVVAITMGFLSAPGPFQLLAFERPNVLTTVFPLVLVPTFAVPLSILLHIAALKRMKLGTGARRRQHFH